MWPSPGQGVIALVRGGKALWDGSRQQQEEIGYVQETNHVSKYIVNNGTQASPYLRKGVQIGKGN